MIRIVQPDGTVEERASMTFAEAQAAVGGYVELLRCPDGSAALMDEDGRMRHRPDNPAATAMVDAAHGLKSASWRLVGTVVIVPKDLLPGVLGYHDDADDEPDGPDDPPGVAVAVDRFDIVTTTTIRDVDGSVRRKFEDAGIAVDPVRLGDVRAERAQQLSGPGFRREVRLLLAEGVDGEAHMARIAALFEAQARSGDADPVVAALAPVVRLAAQVVGGVPGARDALLAALGPEED